MSFLTFPSLHKKRHLTLSLSNPSHQAGMEAIYMIQVWGRLPLVYCTIIEQRNVSLMPIARLAIICHRKRRSRVSQSIIYVLRRLITTRNNLEIGRLADSTVARLCPRPDPRHPVSESGSAAQTRLTYIVLLVSTLLNNAERKEIVRSNAIVISPPTSAGPTSVTGPRQYSLFVSPVRTASYQIASYIYNPVSTPLVEL